MRFAVVAAVAVLGLVNGMKEGKGVSDARRNRENYELNAEVLRCSFDSGSKTLTVEGSGELTSNTWFSSSCLGNFKKTDNVIIEDGITSLGNSVFADCTHLKSVTIADSVKTIGESVFSGCISLESVIMSNNVTVIPDDTFRECGKLKHVNLGKRVQSIEKNAFRGCSELRSLIIPEGLTSLGYKAFCNTPDLSLIYQGSDPITGCSEDSFCQDNIISFCVPSTYPISKPSCGGRLKPILYESCFEHLNVSNHCFEGMLENNAIIQRKKPNATAWENRTNGCFKYQCHNESGGLVWSTCNSTDKTSFVCVNNECLEEGANEGWSVIVDVSELNVTDFSSDETLDELSRHTGIDVNDMSIGTETDGNGVILRLIVYVEDEETATIVTNKVNEMALECSQLQESGSKVR